MSQDVKIFGLEVSAFPNLKIENSNILGHDPRILKTLNSGFLDAKTSNSKLLTAWGHVPGY